MKFLLSSVVLISIILSGCFHSPNDAPQSSCQQLKTQINTFQSNNINQQRITAADQSVIIKQYQDYNCTN